ncbi:hypothetical protein K438DRAFT_1966570 [Mycena galopus ATCC 62051]|nr:hypothetical protein K438DRAFT_1966570 [Mycena galopus ATCC 62051]
MLSRSTFFDLTPSTFTLFPHFFPTRSNSGVEARCFARVSSDPGKGNSMLATITKAPVSGYDECAALSVPMGVFSYQAIDLAVGVIPPSPLDFETKFTSILIDTTFSTDFAGITIPSTTIPSITIPESPTPPTLTSPPPTLTSPPSPPPSLASFTPSSGHTPSPSPVSSISHPSLTGATPLQSSQTTKSATAGSSRASSTSAESVTAGAGFSSHLDTPFPTASTASDGNIPLSDPASRGSKHTAVIVEVLIPLLVIAAVISVVVYKRRRGRRPTVDTESEPDLRSNVSAFDPLPDTPREQWNSSEQDEKHFRSSGQRTISHNGARTGGGIILLSRSGELSRTQTLASSDWPETPLPRYARPLPKLPAK